MDFIYLIFWDNFTTAWKLFINLSYFFLPSPLLLFFRSVFCLSTTATAAANVSLPHTEQQPQLDAYTFTVKEQSIVVVSLVSSRLLEWNFMFRIIIQLCRYRILINLILKLFPYIHFPCVYMCRAALALAFAKEDRRSEVKSTEKFRNFGAVAPFFFAKRWRSRMKMKNCALKSFRRVGSWWEVIKNFIYIFLRFCCCRVGNIQQIGKCVECPRPKAIVGGKMLSFCERSELLPRQIYISFANWASSARR